MFGRVCKVCNISVVESPERIKEHEESSQHKWVVAIRSIIGGQSVSEIFQKYYFEYLNTENVPPEFFQTLLIGQECVSPIEDVSTGLLSNNLNKWSCLLCGTLTPLSSIQIIDHLQSKDHYTLYLATFHPQIYERLKDMVITNLKISRDGCVRIPTKDKQSLYEIYLQQEYTKLGSANAQNSSLYWRDKVPRKCLAHPDLVKEVMEKFENLLANGCVSLEHGIISTKPESYNFQSKLSEAMTQQMELFQIMQATSLKSNGEQALDQSYRERLMGSSKLQATIIDMLQHFLLGTPQTFQAKIEANKLVEGQTSAAASNDSTITSAADTLDHDKNFPETINTNINSKPNDALSSQESLGGTTTSVPTVTTTTTKSSLLQRYLKSEVLKYMNKNKVKAPVLDSEQQSALLNGNIVTNGSEHVISQEGAPEKEAAVEKGTRWSRSRIETSPPLEESHDTRDRHKFATTNAYGTSTEGTTGANLSERSRARQERSTSSTSSSSSSSRSRGDSSSSSHSSSPSTSRGKGRRTSVSPSSRSGRFRPGSQRTIPSNFNSHGTFNKNLGGVAGLTPLMPHNPQAALLSMMVMAAAASSSNPYNNNTVGIHGRNHRGSGSGRGIRSGGYYTKPVSTAEGDTDPVRFVFSDDKDLFVEINDYAPSHMDRLYNVHYGLCNNDEHFNTRSSNSKGGVRSNQEDHHYNGGRPTSYNSKYVKVNHNSNSKDRSKDWGVRQRTVPDDEMAREDNKYDPFANIDDGGNESEDE